MKVRSNINDAGPTKRTWLCISPMRRPSLASRWASASRAALANCGIVLAAARNAATGVIEPSLDGFAPAERRTWSRLQCSLSGEEP